MTEQQEQIIRDWYSLYFPFATTTRVDILIEKLKEGT